jgi:hypothetical protein
MVVEDERGFAGESWNPLPEEPIEPPHYARQNSIRMAHISARMGRIRNQGANASLQNDLIDHMWNLFGNEEN